MERYVFIGRPPDPILGTKLAWTGDGDLRDGDASSSVGFAFALLVKILSESVNDIPALANIRGRVKIATVAP